VVSQPDEMRTEASELEMFHVTSVHVSCGIMLSQLHVYDHHPNGPIS